MRDKERQAIGAYVQYCKLDVWILIPYPPLQRPHSFLRLDSFGPNDVGYFEIQGNVFSVVKLILHYALGILSLARQASSTYKLEAVARSICSSRALLEDANQPAIVAVGGGFKVWLWLS